jgi:hypothetical protein
VVVGLVLASWRAVVCRGWFFGSQPWTIETRRRLSGLIRDGVPFGWLHVAGVLYALSFGLLGIGGWLIADDANSRAGAAVSAMGLLGMLISALLAWRRPAWFLARWHRAEIEHERQG